MTGQDFGNQRTHHGQQDCVVTFDNTRQHASTNLFERNPDTGKQNNRKLTIAVGISFVLIFGLCGYVVYKEVKGAEKVAKPASTQVEQGTSPHKTVAVPRAEKFIGREDSQRTLKEGYRLTGKDSNLSWDSTENNANTFSEPFPNELCIKIKQHGEYEVYNKMTLQYENAITAYHALAHSRADTAGLAPDMKNYILEKNNFQWRPAQSGRVPSILQTVDDIKAAPGDKFCIQTEDTGNIYNSYSDNHLVITKVS